MFAAQAQIDVMAWITYLEHYQAGDERGAEFLRDRFREEFKPAFDAWIAQAAPGKAPPGTPFDLPEYQPKARQLANQLNAEVEEFAATAREANQRSDNFVLVAVVMASVLFIAGVWFMLSMPQSIGI